ncbi:hypothetical protein QS713_00860 [Gleimia hominis]|uniref:Leucine rich repeat variant domain-containing protein n=1 Tax=Gleimia hominis TaxID=595468 RepID=A0ABU3I8B3_9ACTO|nr:hypothetical protein [Gleimia hominis]MDT3766621.1 hypothetical protein [Gleimia hominis]
MDPKLAKKAADPNTPLDELYDIAIAHPKLRPQVAGNPTAHEYPALIEWLGELNDPQIDAALGKRAGTEEADQPAQADSASQSAEPQWTKEPQRGEEPQWGEEPQEAEVEERDQDVEQTTFLPPVDDREGGQTEAYPPAYYPQGTQREYADAQQYQQTQMGQYPQSNQYAAAAAGQEQQYQEAPQSGSSNTRIAVVIAVLSVVAAVMLGLFVATVMGYLTWGKIDKSQPAASVSASAEPTSEPETPQATEEEETPEPSESPSSKEPGYPAPAGAVRAAAFYTPSKNIRCTILADQDKMACQVYESVEDPIGGGQICGGTGGFAVEGTKDGSRSMCGDLGLADDIKLLDYDKAATFGNYACVSRFKGMSCWNTKTGKSFAVSRQGWASGSDGEIAENAFPWGQ